MRQARTASRIEDFGLCVIEKIWCKAYAIATRLDAATGDSFPCWDFAEGVVANRDSRLDRPAAAAAR